MSAAAAAAPAAAATVTAAAPPPPPPPAGPGTSFRAVQVTLSPAVRPGRTRRLSPASAASPPAAPTCSRHYACSGWRPAPRRACKWRADDKSGRMASASARYIVGTACRLHDWCRPRGGGWGGKGALSGTGHNAQLCPGSTRQPPEHSVQQIRFYQGVFHVSGSGGSGKWKWWKWK